MGLQSIIDKEEKSLKNYRKLQLPNQYKKVGLILFAASFTGIFVVGFAADGIPYEDVAKRICKLGILVGLLMISISREKIEDERIINLRMQSYTFAFIWAVLISLIFPFVNYAVDKVLMENSPLQDAGDFFVLWMLLAVQVAFFHVLKKSHS